MRLALNAILLLLPLSCGCTSTVPTRYIPSWIGIPASIITPSSLEAEAYRNQQAVRPTMPTAALSTPVPSEY